MDITANTPSPTARRFEAGTPPVVNCYAAEAGLNMVNAIGMEAIGGRVRDLTRRCMERLDEIGWPAITPADDARRGPMIGIPATEAGALATRLMDRDIVASHRDSNLRLGFHFYNNDDDIDAVIAAMKDLRGEFRS
jgi:selenocysteine lyase/cysteine desulfurase